jgi:hypothetical protein
MTNRHSGDARTEIKRALQPTPYCIPIEQFGSPLSGANRDHLAVCTRCQAEFALWQAFTDPKPQPGEDVAVRCVADELRARGRGEVAGRAAWGGRWRHRIYTPMYIAAASVVLMAVVGYVIWDPEPRLDELRPPEQTYRTTRVQGLAPTGELVAAPTELKWVTVDGAVRYDVRVLEVDGTQIWSSSTPDTRIALPAEIIEQFVAGKTISWDVTARNGTGDAVAISGRHQFRVSIDSRQRRD